MPLSTSIVGIVTALGTALTAIALVITAIGGLKRSRLIEHKVDDVHIIVNQQRTDMQRYIRAQSALLTKHGIDLPIDQSIDPTEQR